MEKRLYGLVTILLIILVTQELLMQSEAIRMCKSRSREYKSRRCYNRNCNIICLHEHFRYGKCERFKCYCIKPCGSEGGSGGGGGGGSEGGSGGGGGAGSEGGAGGGGGSGGGSGGTPSEPPPKNLSIKKID
ncbi:UNVERIFIED_CONTAM: hypothetical protein Sradi_5528400 [Sesamum radiatum]|uniref:Knottins-like domain-containing protein n=1 Tax=Sesamum radiatum TaxID=300843 RepID=A0AAW2LAY9_SESRA